MRKSTIVSSEVRRRRTPYKMVNLTGHVVRYITATKRLVEIKPTGIVRVQPDCIDVDYLPAVHLIKAQTAVRLRFVGLPDPSPGTLYIVSNITLRALQETGSTRRDIISPATTYQDTPVTCHRGVYAVQKFNTLRQAGKVSGRS